MNMEWQPISEAPVSNDPFLVDVHRCLLFVQGAGICMGRAWRYPDGHAVAQADSYLGDWEITHFMPLPPPPGEKA